MTNGGGAAVEGEDEAGPPLNELLFERSRKNTKLVTANERKQP